MQKLEKSIINIRRSIRKYDPSVPVTRAQIDSLLEAAMLAPSARNTRPWEFIAVTKREILDEIAEIHPYAGMCKTATAAIVVIALPQTELVVGYYPQDCGAAAQNILLRAVELGLGACWCGVYPRQERIPLFRKLFDIPEPKIPFCVIAIGTATEQPSQRGFFEAEKVTYIN